jgi:hypothetical protein
MSMLTKAADQQVAIEGRELDDALASFDAYFLQKKRGFCRLITLLFISKESSWDKQACSRRVPRGGWWWWASFCLVNVLVNTTRAHLILTASF